LPQVLSACDGGARGVLSVAEKLINQGLVYNGNYGGHSFVIIFLPWLVRDMLVLGNPVFPLLNEYFKSPHASGSLNEFSAIMSNDMGSEMILAS